VGFDCIKIEPFVFQSNELQLLLAKGHKQRFLVFFFFSFYSDSFPITSTVVSNSQANK